MDEQSLIEQIEQSNIFTIDSIIDEKIDEKRLNTYSDAVINAILRIKGQYILSIKSERHTIEMALAALPTLDNLLTHYINHTVKNAEYYQLAVSLNKIDLPCIPSQYLTTELCKQAIIDNNNPAWLQFVPHHLLTYSFMTELVQSDGRSISYAPEDMIDQALCDLATQNTPYALTDIPKRFVTQAMVDTYPKKETLLHRSKIPREMITPAFMIDMLTQDRYTFKLLSTLPSDQYSLEDIKVIAGLQPDALRQHLLPACESLDEALLQRWNAALSGIESGALDSSGKDGITQRMVGPLSKALKAAPEMDAKTFDQVHEAAEHCSRLNIKAKALNTLVAKHLTQDAPKPSKHKQADGYSL